MNIDPYIYPGTNVLRNRSGLREQAELSQLENAVTTVALTRLADTRLPGKYDLVHLQAFHRFVFGDVYPWAGELRTVAIAKADMFCLPQYIESYAGDVLDRLAAEDYLRGRDRTRFLDGLAQLWADLNSLHPFRDGNGRATRAFLSQLARDAGHPVTWEGLDQAANIAASIAAHHGDTGPMRTLLEQLVTIS
jgi:cell filamentation protein